MFQFISFMFKAEVLQKQLRDINSQKMMLMGLDVSEKANIGTIQIVKQTGLASSQGLKNAVTSPNNSGRLNREKWLELCGQDVEKEAEASPNFCDSSSLENEWWGPSQTKKRKEDEEDTELQKILQSMPVYHDFISASDTDDEVSVHFSVSVEEFCKGRLAEKLDIYIYVCVLTWARGCQKSYLVVNSKATCCDLSLLRNDPLLICARMAIVFVTFRKRKSVLQADRQRFYLVRAFCHHGNGNIDMSYAIMCM